MSAAPFRGLRPPLPPAELRGRVLAACHAVLAAEARPDLVDRLWLSRAARAAWLAAVLVLLAANLMVAWTPAGGDGELRGTPSAYRWASEEVDLRPLPWRPRPERSTWATFRHGARPPLPELE